MGLVKDRILVLGDLWDRADLVAEVNQDREGQGAQQMDPEVGEDQVDPRPLVPRITALIANGRRAQTGVKALGPRGGTEARVRLRTGQAGRQGLGPRRRHGLAGRAVRRSRRRHR